MAQLSKQELLEEAKKQSEMLERISRWRTYSLVLSAIGVAVAYMGFKGSFHPIAVGVTGIVIIMAGMAFSIFCNFGIRTGRENVERILRAAENSK
ncbi:MAG: hypothetical protein IJX83_07460 [Lachnospiraceae bacterium]|nr:hypothetical protein [Lachnospiraceae bacterium]